jgi:hypothetical protein
MPDAPHKSGQFGLIFQVNEEVIIEDYLPIG